MKEQEHMFIPNELRRSTQDNDALNLRASTSTLVLQLRVLGLEASKCI